jgi:hypothetical protein
MAIQVDQLILFVMQVHNKFFSTVSRSRNQGKVLQSATHGGCDLVLGQMGRNLFSTT